MNEENEDTDQPLISQVTENNQENRQAVVESIFEKVAFRTNEDMTEETTEVLSKLSNVEYLHFQGGLGDARNGGKKVSVRVTLSSEPSRHELGFY